MESNSRVGENCIISHNEFSFEDIDKDDVSYDKMKHDINNSFELNNLSIVKMNKKIGRIKKNSGLVGKHN